VVSIAGCGIEQQVLPNVIYRLPNEALVQKVREPRIEFESVLNSNSYESLCSILIRIESNLAKVRFDSIRAER
jgi:hypothetical protein